MGKLEGKIAVITGGNRNISFATAKWLVNEGAYVFTMDHRDPELAAALQEMGRNVACVRGDVSDPRDLDHLFGQIKREKGELDIVVANAAGDEYPSFGKITQEPAKRRSRSECSTPPLCLWAAWVSPRHLVA